MVQHGLLVAFGLKNAKSGYIILIPTFGHINAHVFWLKFAKESTHFMLCFGLDTESEDVFLSPGELTH